MRLRLRVFFALASLCTATPVFAADAPAERYAILSLIGDAMTIVTYVPAVGSNLDSNARQNVALADDSFNRAAETETETVIRRVVPGAKTVTLTMSDPELTAHSEDLVESADRVKALVAPIAAQLGPDTRWLVLVSKHHGDVRLRVANGAIGAGKLSGLGFYVDRFRRMTRPDTGETGRGFLAPYAYVSVSLVDLATGTVVRTRSSEESTTLSSARSATSTDPWQALTGEQKTQMLQRMVRRAIDTNVPLVLAPT